MAHWYEYWPLLLYFTIPAAAIALFLAIGLYWHRDRAIPVAWWALLIAVCATPTVVGVLGIAFMADHPRLSADRPDNGAWAGVIGGVLALLGLVGPPSLATLTLFYSDKRRPLWVVGVLMACLCLVPLFLLAVLAAAQMISGVSF